MALALSTFLKSAETEPLKSYKDTQSQFFFSENVFNYSKQ